MKLLIKTALILASFFMLTFVLLFLFGFNKSDVELMIYEVNKLSPLILSMTVIILLFADLFIAVPTLTISILAGYFLGFSNGFIVVVTGLVLVGMAGYFISYYFGERVLRKISNKDDIAEMNRLVRDHGLIMLLLCRATPVIPEVTACLCGISKMPIIRFIFGWLVNSIPYAAIATYAGSISTLQKPMPAIYTAIGISLILGSAWYYLIRVKI